MLPASFFAFLPLLPQTPCNSPGPDLVMGDTNPIANYASVGGVEALAVGYRPCNVGSVGIAYSAGTASHPVYGSALYRLRTVGGATRLEQVGQSWLRHGFFALSQSLLCTCSPTDGTTLGAGCSDSLTNGGASVGSWGPRWQVDAADGTFHFPPEDPPHSGVDRLLQVHVADLEPTGAPGAARYFLEIHGVAADDAAAGNRDNNSSHREIAVSGAGSAWTFAYLAGASTEVERPALLAWRDADPSVVVDEVVVPGDGRFVLASRATDLGGGVWHYEYSLLNQSSDRSARTFVVPFSPGGAPSNVGFHDVDYHSGDGPGNVDFDDTDWTAVFAFPQLTFSTDDFATNPSANALRWGTTYSFRFDANLPPSNGLLSIDLFEPGTPDSVSIGGIVPVTPPPPPMGYCFGDGSSGPCPCANAGGMGRGCQNSAGTGGAHLSVSGLASLSADSVQITSADELPTSLSIVLQGSLSIAPVAFGDGLRCAGGTLKRLYVRNAVGGVVVAPQAGDPSVSARSAALGDPIPIGGTREYQTYYRDANAGFCPVPTGSTFNASGAISLTWGG